MPENNYDVFLSYHWRDHVHAEGIARALRDRDLHVFLDRWYLHPGRRQVLGITANESGQLYRYC